MGVMHGHEVAHVVRIERPHVEDLRAVSIDAFEMLASREPHRLALARRNHLQLAHRSLSPQPIGLRNQGHCNLASSDQCRRSSDSIKAVDISYLVAYISPRRIDYYPGGAAEQAEAGLSALLGGLREIHADDDRLVTAAAVFDALYAAPGDSP
jgi:hypothetical protein